MARADGFSQPLPLTARRMQGDVVLVATEYEDGWSRGMKLETKEVRACAPVVGRAGMGRISCKRFQYLCFN